MIPEGHFTLLAPQRVQHSSGFLVQVKDRSHVEYIEGDDVAMVEVDFGRTMAIYEDTLKLVGSDSARDTMSPQRRDEIVDRIRAGMKFMGVVLDPPRASGELEIRSTAR